MKKTMLALLGALCLLPAGAAEQLPPREQTLKTLVKVNDHYLKKHPDPGVTIPY